MLDLCPLFTSFQDNEPVLWKLTKILKLLFSSVFIVIMNLHVFDGYEPQNSLQIIHPMTTIFLRNFHYIAVSVIFEKPKSHHTTCHLIPSNVSSLR